MPDPLRPVETHLLIALRDAPSYGYALGQTIEERSGGEIQPDVGALYRTLARMMEEGWVAEVEAPAEAEPSGRGRPRRYYGITPRGREVLRDEVRRMAELITLSGLREAEGPRGA